MPDTLGEVGRISPHVMEVPGSRKLALADLEHSSASGRDAQWDAFGALGQGSMRRVIDELEEAPVVFQRTYDRVIVTPDWEMDDSLFDPAIRPLRSSVSKFPAMTPRYESPNVPGLFFAGSLAHGPDFKKSAGGFVHGYR